MQKTKVIRINSMLYKQLEDYAKEVGAHSTGYMLEKAIYDMINEVAATAQTAVKTVAAKPVREKEIKKIEIKKVKSIYIYYKRNEFIWMTDTHFDYKLVMHCIGFFIYEKKNEYALRFQSQCVFNKGEEPDADDLDEGQVDSAEQIWYLIEEKYEGIMKSRNINRQVNKPDRELEEYEI